MRVVRVVLSTMYGLRMSSLKGSLGRRWLWMLGLSGRLCSCGRRALFLLLEAERVPFGSFHQSSVVVIVRTVSAREKD